MIYTFYSYKGGVGRSMALVNIAELMYRAGLRVMMVDWDLEAPGLERFYPDLVVDILARPGVVEMLATYKERALRYQPDDGKPLFPVDNIWSYAIDLHPDDDCPGKLWLVPAGYRAGGEFFDYANRVKGFDWKDFYEKWAGESYIDWLREHLEVSADVILVDSRTGVTEIGGVCAYQLADVVVMLCATNEQNMDGTQQMLQSFTDSRLPELRHGRPLVPVVVPARIEIFSQLTERNDFHAHFHKRFASCIPAVFRRDPDFFRKCAIPYVAFYSFWELIAVNQTDTPQRSMELESAYESLVAVLASLAADGSIIRQHVATTLPERSVLEGPNQSEIRMQFEARLREARFLLDSNDERESLYKAAALVDDALAMVGFERDPQGVALRARIKEEFLRQEEVERALDQSTRLMRQGEFRHAAELLAQRDVPERMLKVYRSRCDLAQALAAAETAEMHENWRYALLGYREALQGDPLLERTIASRIEGCQDHLAVELHTQVQQMLDRWPPASDEAQALLRRADQEGWLGGAQRSLMESLDSEIRVQQMASEVLETLERSPRDTASARVLLEKVRKSVRTSDAAERLATWDLLVRTAANCESACRSLEQRDIDAAGRALERLRSGPLAELPLLDDLQHNLDQAQASVSRLRVQQELDVALSKGRAAFEAGNLQLARLSFEKVLQAAPGHIEARTGLLAVLSKAAAEAEIQGRSEEATAYYDAALQIDPNNVEIRERKRRTTAPSPVPAPTPPRWRYVLLAFAAVIVVAMVVWIILKLSGQAAPAPGSVAPIALAISDNLAQTLHI